MMTLLKRFCTKIGTQKNINHFNRLFWSQNIAILLWSHRRNIMLELVWTFWKYTFFFKIVQKFLELLLLNNFRIFKKKLLLCDLFKSEIWKKSNHFLKDFPWFFYFPPFFTKIWWINNKKKTGRQQNLYGSTTPLSLTQITGNETYTLNAKLIRTSWPSAPVDF